MASDLRAVGVILLVAVVWILLVDPLLIGLGAFSAQPPLIQFLVYNIGYFALFATFFSLIMGGWFKGAGIGIPLFLALDNLQPPFFVNLNTGLPAITDPAALAGASIDATLYSFWRPVISPNWQIPFTDFAVIYFLVYVVSTALLLLIALAVFRMKGEQIEDAL